MINFEMSKLMEIPFAITMFIVLTGGIWLFFSIRGKKVSDGMETVNDIRLPVPLTIDSVTLLDRGNIVPMGNEGDYMCVSLTRRGETALKLGDKRLLPSSRKFMEKLRG